MPSLTDRILSLWSKRGTANAPVETIYEQRVQCLKNLTNMQLNLKQAEEQNATVTPTEGLHTLAWNALDVHVKEYKKEYERCEPILKM